MTEKFNEKNNVGPQRWKEGITGSSESKIPWGEILSVSLEKDKQIKSLTSEYSWRICSYKSLCE